MAPRPRTSPIASKRPASARTGSTRDARAAGRDHVRNLVLEAEENALLRGIIEALLIGFLAIGDGLFLTEALGLRTGKHSNVRCIHQRCVVDPFLGVGDLFIQLFTLRQSKVVSDSSAS